MKYDFDMEYDSMHFVKLALVQDEELRSYNFVLDKMCLIKNLVIHQVQRSLLVHS